MELNGLFLKDVQVSICSFLKTSLTRDKSITYSASLAGTGVSARAALATAGAVAARSAITGHSEFDIFKVGVRCSFRNCRNLRRKMHFWRKSSFYREFDVYDSLHHSGVSGEGHMIRLLLI
jgi:hypothetical protein